MYSLQSDAKFYMAVEDAASPELTEGLKFRSSVVDLKDIEIRPYKSNMNNFSQKVICLAFPNFCICVMCEVEREAHS